MFVPPLGDDEEREVMEQARAQARAQERAAVERLLARPTPDQNTVGQVFETGLYGTQRQTVMLVDWDGRVTFVERALWDNSGNTMRKEEADVREEFVIEGWND